MKKTVLYLSVVFLLFVTKANSQTLDWSSSFSPAWVDAGTSGTASNVGGSGINVSVAITNSQSGTYQDITGGGIIAPAVNTNNGRANFFILAGSTDALEIDVDWTNKTAFVDAVYSFSQPVYNLVFRVGDIDKRSSNSNTFYDRVTITGLNGTASVLPQSITAVNATGNYVTISGNVAHANTTSGVGGNASTNSTSASTQQGTVQVDFGSQGVTQVTIRYDNHPLSQANPALQAIAIGNMAFSLVNISGTVWNDINNSANNTFSNIFTTGESGTNAGSSLYVNLVNNSGIVVNCAAVAANGTYSLTAPRNTTNLTLRLSTTQGVPGSAAPANSVPSGWVNTSPLQTANFNTTTANISARDFGIEQFPETAIRTLSATGNPGGFNNVLIAASSFHVGTGGNPNTSDAGAGTVTNMRIVSFPANTNAIVINGTTYTNGGACPPATTCTAWPAGGVTVAYTNGTGPSVPIRIDPIEGNVSSVISFAAIDNAGKEDASPGNVTIPFATIPLSGVVWNDGNGNLVQDGGEAIINGTNSGGGLLPGAALYANLTDPSGIVIATVAVQSNGQYTFSDIPQTTNNLTVQINTVQGVVGNAKPALIIPAGWGSAGENKNGQGGPSDAQPNGEIILNAGTTTITLQNFGLDRLPVPDDKNYPINTPVVNAFIPLNGIGALPGPLTGNDAEDGTLGSADEVAITSLPANGNELWYNSVEITTGADGINPPSVSNPYLINNYNPNLLQVRVTALGSTSAGFDYAFIDAAGLQGASASYELNWSTPLPVTLISFTAKPVDNNTVLNWKVENQVDFDRYEIEYSATGTGQYDVVGTVHSNNQPAGSYEFIHTNASAFSNTVYYRLKMIDIDGRFKYSHIVIVRFDKGITVDLRPSLLKSGEPIRITIAGTPAKANRVKIINLAGQIVEEKTMNGNNLLIETSKLKAGTYLLKIYGDVIKQTFKIVVQ